MFNQLADSNREKKLKRRDLYAQFNKKKQLIYMDRSPTQESNNDYLRDRQQMVKSQLQANTVQNQDRINLSSIIRYKLQSKKVQLPDTLSPEMHDQIKGIDQQKIVINNYLARSGKYDSLTKQRKRRIRTYQDDENSESQQQNQKYKKTLKEIDDLNQLFFKNNRKREARIKDLVYQSSRMRRDFNHISRQKDFQRYINHLDNLSSNQSQVRREMYRVDTPINYKKLPQISPRKTEETNSLIKMPASPNLQKNSNDTFIKILKKVKARGESLLVKLNKFPSLKNMSK